MEDILTVEMTYSEYHTIFPKIIITILGILLLAILVRFVISQVKSKDNRFKLTKASFPPIDKVKLFGSLVLLFIYPFFMNLAGFVVATVVFMIALTLLLMGRVNRRAMIVSTVNSIATTLVVWFVFGQVFDITLP